MTLHSVCEFWSINDISNCAHVIHNILNFGPMDPSMQFSQKIWLTFEVMCQPPALWTLLELNDRLIINRLGNIWILDTDCCWNICLTTDKMLNDRKINIIWETRFNYQLNAQFLYSIINVLHYNPRHVSSNTMLILRRSKLYCYSVPSSQQYEVKFFGHSRNCALGVCSTWSDCQWEVLLRGFETTERKCEAPMAWDVEERKLVVAPRQCAYTRDHCSPPCLLTWPGSLRFVRVP
jgi:hypothetical protein